MAFAPDCTTTGILERLCHILPASVAPFLQDYGIRALSHSAPKAHDILAARLPDVHTRLAEARDSIRQRAEDATNKNESLKRTRGAARFPDLTDWLQHQLQEESKRLHRTIFQDQLIVATRQWLSEHGGHRDRRIWTVDEALARNPYLLDQ